MDSARRTALVAGLFYLITFAAAIPAVFLGRRGASEGTTREYRDAHGPWRIAGGVQHRNTATCPDPGGLEWTL